MFSDIKKLLEIFEPRAYLHDKKKLSIEHKKWQNDCLLMARGEVKEVIF